VGGGGGGGGGISVNGVLTVILKSKRFVNNMGSHNVRTH